MADEHDDRPAGPGAGGRLLRARVPVWVLIAAVVVVAAVLGGYVVYQRATAIDLGPAVGGAEEIEMRLVICNQEVDQRGINPREAELDLQELLTDEGAGEARVRVDRQDCPDAEADDG